MITIPTGGVLPFKYGAALGAEFFVGGMAYLLGGLRIALFTVIGLGWHICQMLDNIFHLKIPARWLNLEHSEQSHFGLFSLVYTGLVLLPLSLLDFLYTYFLSPLLLHFAMLVGTVIGGLCLSGPGYLMHGIDGNIANDLHCTLETLGREDVETDATEIKRDPSFFSGHWFTSSMYFNDRPVLDAYLSLWRKFYIHIAPLDPDETKFLNSVTLLTGQFLWPTSAFNMFEEFAYFPKEQIEDSMKEEDPAYRFLNDLGSLSSSSDETPKADGKGVFSQFKQKTKDAYQNTKEKVDEKLGGSKKKVKKGSRLARLGKKFF